MMARVELVNFDSVAAAAVLFSETPTSFSFLVVGFSLDPASMWKMSHSELAALVINDNCCGEGESWEPPVYL